MVLTGRRRDKPLSLPTMGGGSTLDDNYERWLRCIAKLEVLEVGERMRGDYTCLFEEHFV